MRRDNRQRRAARAWERAGAGPGAGAGAPRFPRFPRLPDDVLDGIADDYGGDAGEFGGDWDWFGEDEGSDETGFGQFETAGHPAVDDQVREAIDSAVRAAAHHRLGRDPGLADLRFHLNDPSTRRLVLTALTTRLAGHIDQAWTRGWQPADLARVAARTASEPVRLVIVDAIAHNLGAYAVTTLAPRWPAQLAEIGAERWWERDIDPLTARAVRQGAPLDGFLPVIVEAIRVLASLGALPILDPLPGTATPAAADRPRVDERLLARVRAFLAKAEATPYEAEAEAFTAAAQALMARHSIDQAMLSAGSASPDEPAGRRIGVERPYEAAKVTLLQVVADANRCRPVWSKDLGFVTVIGFEADLLATETLFTSLLVQATTAVAAQGRRTGWGGGSETRSFRQSFLTGFAHRIGQRLATVTDEAMAAARAEAVADPGRDIGAVGEPPPGRSTDLVVLLAERAEEVSARVERLFPILARSSTVRATNAQGWSAGVSAADRAQLHTGVGSGDG